MKNPATNTVQLKEEMEFRMSLLRLMTVPHGGLGGVEPGVDSSDKTMEELSGVLVPVKARRTPRASAQA
jgi:hypothetical protein